MQWQWLELLTEKISKKHCVSELLQRNESFMKSTAMNEWKKNMLYENFPVNYVPNV